MEKRNTVTPASYLVLIKNDKILLLRRFNTGFEDGNYSIIAGHVEKGETFTQCIIREAKEEAGIIIDEKDLKVCHVMHRDSKRETNNERIDVFFTTSEWKGEIKNIEPNKCDDLSWFDINNLPINTIDYIKQAIESISLNIPYSEYGWNKNSI